VPNRWLFLAAGLVLVGMGIYGLAMGVMPARGGHVERNERPLTFWFLLAVYFGLGAVMLRFACKT
jgi:hypothetical protein